MSLNLTSIHYLLVAPDKEILYDNIELKMEYNILSITPRYKKMILPREFRDFNHRKIDMFLL